MTITEILTYLQKIYGLYFLTAKGKSFCDRLMERGYVVVSGMKGQDTR